MPHRVDFTSPKETSGYGDKQEEGGTPGLLAAFHPSKTSVTGSIPQLLILKAPWVPTGTSHSTQDNLSSLCLSPNSCSMTPFQLAASSSPEITLGPSHGLMVLSGISAPS